MLEEWAAAHVRKADYSRRTAEKDASIGHQKEPGRVMHNSEESWEGFLDPAVLRPRLVTASIYISTFELLKTAIIDRIRDFFTSGSDQVSPEYQSDVLAKNASPVYASLEWLKEARAIDDADIAAFERVKKLRNELAHTLTATFFHGLRAEIAERLGEMVSLLDKIERWWIVNVEIATNRT